jgi:hypothetical protein
MVPAAEISPVPPLKSDWLPYLTLAVAALGSVALVAVAILHYHTQKLVRKNTAVTEETARKTVDIAVSVDGRVSQLLKANEEIIVALKEQFAAQLAKAVAEAFTAGGLKARTEARAVSDARAEGVREGSAREPEKGAP